MMATGGRKTSLSQAKAVAALMAVGTVAEAARLANVGERTLFRWLSEDAGFRAELATAEGQAITAAARRLVGLSDAAISTVAAVIDDPDATPANRLRAAGMALEYCVTWRELSSLEARIGALESTVNHAN
jgi:hypothetical protein